MKLKDNLDKMVRTNIEVSDLNRVNVEVYSSIDNWKNHMYTFVNEREPHQIRENVKTISISMLSIDDEDSIKRFRDLGSKTTFYDVSLESIKRRLDEGSYSHIFLENIGELDESQIAELKSWIEEKLSGENGD
jgi:hypothetical protein